MKKLILALVVLVCSSFAWGQTPFSFTCPSPLPAGTVGVYYKVMCPITGGTPPYKAAISDGMLPPGLKISVVQVGTGYSIMIDGIPTSFSGLPESPTNLKTTLSPTPTKPNTQPRSSSTFVAKASKKK